MTAQLGMFDHLVRMTCRILTQKGKKSGVGTGFFYAFPNRDGHGIAVVTNRHVLAGATEIQIAVAISDSAGTVVPNGHTRLKLTNAQAGIHYHADPNIDLACFPIGTLLQNLEQGGRKPIFSVILENQIPPKDEKFSAVEEILMVGYPSGVFDSVHNLPIVRRGITASGYNIDFEGRPEFLIDAACFPGSSGSPIFIAQSGAFNAPGGGLVVGQQRFRFLGVLHSGPRYTGVGEIKVKPIPTSTEQIALTPMMMNLGYCVKAEKVRELIVGAQAKLAAG